MADGARIIGKSIKTIRQRSILKLSFSFSTVIIDSRWIQFFNLNWEDFRRAKQSRVEIERSRAEQSISNQWQQKQIREYLLMKFVIVVFRRYHSFKWTIMYDTTNIHVYFGVWCLRLHRISFRIYIEFPSSSQHKSSALSFYIAWSKLSIHFEFNVNHRIRKCGRTIC